MTIDKYSKELHKSLVRLVRAYQFRDKNKLFDCCQGLTVNQYYVLAAIFENGPLGIVELSKLLYQDKGNISRIVDNLVDNGYLSKTTHPNDRRALILNVTKKGKDVYKQIEKIEINDISKLITNLNIENPEKMIKLLSAFADEAENSFK